MTTRGYCRTCHQTLDPEVSLCPACGATPIPFPADLDIGDLLPGDIRIVRLLDEGGMGAVFVGLQEGLKREVAVKVIRSSLSRDPAVTRRFLEEGPLLAQLEHPNTVRVLHQGRSKEGHLFLVMELLRGRTLRDLLLQEPTLSIERMSRIGVQVCNSLEEAHAKGLVHRDLKPEHVFLQDHPGNPDFVRVFDFGIARSAEGAATDRMTQPGVVFGTITYMSPEQANGDDVDLRSDIYSMGVMFHEMLTGDPIFRSANPLAVLMRKLTYEPAPMRVKHPERGIPPELDDLVASMLSSRAENRPASMAEVRELLLRLQAEPAVVAVGSGRAAEAGAPPVVEVEATRIGTRPLLAPRFEITECLGRAAEKDLLLDFVSRFEHSGDPNVLLVDGPTGVGKSRLVGWLQKRAAGYTALRVSRGVFSRFNTTVSLQAVKDAVRALLDVDDSGAPTEPNQASVKVSTSLRRWDITDTDLALILSELIYPGQVGAAASLARVGQERYWEAAYMALLTLLREVGARTRLLLILDDVQWADPRSIEFLQILLDAMRAHTLHVSLVLVVNTEEAEDKDAFSALLVWMLRNLSAMTRQITLQPLLGTDFDDFVNAILPLEPRSREKLFRMSRGNPFFAIELLQFLFNEHELLRIDNRFSFRDPESQLASVPLTLKDLVQRKLTRFKEHSSVAAEAMVVLEHVAFFADPLPVDVLEAALAADPSADRVRERLDDVLDALSRERLLKLDARAGDEVLEPYHPIVTLYLQAEYGRGRRGRRIHRAFAGALEARIRRRDPYAVERIGYHHRRAGDGRQALAFYREAGFGWHDRHEYERAKECLALWLAIAEDVPAVDDSAVLEVLSRQAQIQTLCGEFQAAEQVWRRVLTRCTPDSPDGSYGRALVGLSEIRGHHEGGIDDDLRHAARYFGRHGHRLDQALAVARQADGFVDHGRLDVGRRLFATAERLLEAVGAQAELASLLNRRGLAAIHGGAVDEALGLFERGLKVQAELGNPVELARAYNNIGIGLIQQGLLVEAERYLTDGLARLGDVNHPLGRISLLINLGVVQNLRRDFPAALQHLDQAYALAQRIYSRRLIARVLVNKASTLLEAGRADEALRLAIEAHDAFVTFNAPTQGWASTALLGDLYLRTGDAIQARRFLERAYHQAVALRLRTANVAEVLQMLAQLYEKEGNAAAAAQALLEAEQIYATLRNVTAQSRIGEKRRHLTGRFVAGQRPAGVSPADAPG